MARLPQPGGDPDNWGNILNDFLSQTHDSDGSLKSGAVTAAKIADGSIAETKLDTAAQAKLNSVGSGSVADGSITTAKLQDDAVTNVKIAASAAIAQSKVANLTTDLAGKAAISHTHTAAQISDSTATGRSLVAAADAAAARTAIGAGSSNLALGTTNATAKAGDYVPTKADVGLGNVDNTSDATKNSATSTLVNKTISGANNTIVAVPQSSVTSLTTDLAAKAPLAGTPRYLLYSSGWPNRPTDTRMTFFLGGSAATDAPADVDIQTGDVWIPTS